MNLLQNHPDYWLFHSMKKRCLNPNHVSYHSYGGRGISVCERWLMPRGKGFLNFISDMGPRPQGTTLERINNNGNYEPSNCKWATFKEQHSNRRSNIFVEYDGKNLTLTQWAKLLGLRGGDIIKKRLLKYPKEIALTQHNLQSPEKYISKAIAAAAIKRKSQTHCKRGHEFTIENTYLYKGCRTCRQCKKELSKKRLLQTQFVKC